MNRRTWLKSLAAAGLAAVARVYPTPTLPEVVKTALPTRPFGAFSCWVKSGQDVEVWCRKPDGEEELATVTRTENYPGGWVRVTCAPTEMPEDLRGMSFRVTPGGVAMGAIEWTT